MSTITINDKFIYKPPIENINNLTTQPAQTNVQKSMGQAPKYKDPLLKFPLRGLAYSNEIGVAISEIAPKLGTLLWAPALLYFGADIYDKYKNDKMEYDPSKRRGTKQAIFQALASVIFPTAAVISGQKLINPIGKLTKSKLTLSESEQTIRSVLDFIEQEKIATNQANPDEYKKKLHTFLDNRITEKQNEFFSTNPFKRFFKNLEGDYALLKFAKKKTKLYQFADKNIDNILSIWQNLQSNENKKKVNKKLRKIFEKQKIALEEKNAADVIKHAAKLTIKNYEKSLIFNNKIIRTIGGFISLGLMIKPIDIFVEHTIIPKFVSPGLDKIDQFQPQMFIPQNFLEHYTKTKKQV